jgi:DNA-binding transcriptional LysR family regulator
MNFHRLRVFREVARHLSFSRAAEELYTSQPNVSRHIAKLEAELGVTLFHRLGTRVALTDAGRMVYDYAQRVFELTEGLHRALNELRGLERGYLRLGASSTPGLYLLPPMVAGFQRRHPGLEIALHLANTQEVVGKVLGNEVDLGFVEAPVTTPGVQVQPYTRDVLVPIAAPDHPLTAVPRVKPEDLAQETLVLREEGSGTRQVLEEALARWGVRPHRVLVINGCEGVKRAVAAGLGISFVSHHAIELERVQGMVKVLAGEELRLERALLIVTHKDIRPSAAALAFLAYVRKGL